MKYFTLLEVAKEIDHKTKKGSDYDEIHQQILK